MDIRQLRPDDASAYRRLRIEASADPDFASDPEVEVATPVELLRMALSNPSSGEILGAFDSRELIGVIGLGKSDMTSDGTVFGLFVVPDARGRGTGRALLRALVDRVSDDDDLRNLELKVRASNTIARRLYETEGFTTSGSEQSVVLMRLCL